MSVTRYPYLSFVCLETIKDLTWYIFRVHRGPDAKPELAVVDGTEGAKDSELRDLLGSNEDEEVAYDQRIGHWYSRPLNDPCTDENIITAKKPTINTATESSARAAKPVAKPTTKTTTLRSKLKSTSK
jgi:hypothetical protein